ncbi:MAG: hypothetical protein ACE5FS_03355 [Paracoccaceae bacterium]
MKPIIIAATVLLAGCATKGITTLTDGPTTVKEWAFSRGAVYTVESDGKVMPAGAVAVQNPFLGVAKVVAGPVATVAAGALIGRGLGGVDVNVSP